MIDEKDLAQDLVKLCQKHGLCFSALVTDEDMLVGFVLGEKNFIESPNQDYRAEGLYIPPSLQ